ncbi:MAG: PAAR domain-containing protein [Planctomycetaceae bacterium]|nr:PAAR domain-containing protein [Planctomycetaceae bacterium]
MMPAARISDMHICPMVTGIVPHVGGPIAIGFPTVLIGFMPAARVLDMAVCVGPPDLIAKGSLTVKIGFMPAARMGDLTAHGGMIAIGCPTVFIGDVGMGGAGTTQGRALSAAKQSGMPFCEVCQK